jgi:hypothetical protein
MLAEYRNAGAPLGRWRHLILICVGFGLAAATTLLPEFVKGPGWVAAAVAIGCGALGKFLEADARQNYRPPDSPRHGLVIRVLAKLWVTIDRVRKGQRR